MSENPNTKEIHPVSLIAGASSGVGRALASLLAGQKHDLCLLARNREDLEAVASDCRLRHGVKVETFAADIGAADFSTKELEKWFGKTLGPPQNVFLIAGANDANDTAPPAEAVIERMTRVNYLGPGKIASLAAARQSDWKLRNLVVCSSIAAAVPRGRNTAYAAAKCALEALVLGIRHSLAATDVKVQVYRLGYVDTSLSYGQKLLLPSADPAKVAQSLADNLDRDLGICYYPAYWRFIVAILRGLPWCLFKRLRF